ncbi:MAG: glycosyltransferase family protein [Acidimicrobiales bacterium]
MRSRYLFWSHDGFGLGHVRRNSLIAAAILVHEPDAEIVLVTGVAVRPSWLGAGNVRVVHVPSMLKDQDGAYRHEALPFEVAVGRRARMFHRTVEEFRPDVVVVDRHPYGIAGELRRGLDLAHRQGAAVVLGLRDVLDEPSNVRDELAGEGWAGVADAFDALLVYGDQVLCDHEVEYGVPLIPIYCGWVVERPAPTTRDERLLVVTAGGGGDGEAVFRLGLGLAHVLLDHRVMLVAGPYATRYDASADGDFDGRLTVVRDVPGCVELFARAGAVVQMAGYNSTAESLAAGVRPVLVPRRSPRREQAIRASRLASMGLADVVDEHAPADEVAWLVRRSRQLCAGQLAANGLRIDGAHEAASVLRSMAAVPAP